MSRLKDKYYILPLDYQTAMSVVIKYHYLHRQAPCSRAFGLYERDTDGLVGVIIYGVSSSSTLLKGVCGPEEMHNVYELTRLWVRDGTPKNTESFFIGNTLPLLDKEIIVSFAEASVGHCGTIYQASNFLYCGMTTKFVDPVVKGLENQHHSTFAHGMTKEEVIAKFGDGVQFVERPRKHRYVYFNAKRSRRRELMSKLKYKTMPYPKAEKIVRTGACDDAPKYLATPQGMLFI